MVLRKLFLVLNGEYPKLAFSEVLAILQVMERNYSSVTKFDQLLRISTSTDSVQVIAQRSALVHRCCAQLFESGNTVEEIMEAAKEMTFNISLRLEKSFAVRIKRIKNYGAHIDKVDLERKLGAVILNHLKQVNNEIKVNLETPEITFYGVFTEDRFFFGISLWRSETYFQRFDARRGHKRAFFHPGTLEPRLARVLVNLSRAKEDKLFLDPFAGSASTLIEARLIGATIIGCDIQKRMVQGSLVNLQQFHLSGDLVCADARHLPFTDDIYAIATDPPYGRSSTTKGIELNTLIHSFLGSATNILQKKRYICICAPLSIKLQEIANEIGLKTVELHKMRVHKSLTRRIGVFQN
ncbi:MAG: DNA methyltransferase [Promethearchaeota archaeon]